MIETELKIEVGYGLGEIRRKLERWTGERASRVYELTVMYDNPSGLMQKTNARVRLRKIKQAGGKKIEFSYKLPLSGKSVKREEEYEVGVSDFEEMEKILERLEFKPVSSYERYRTTFEVDGTKVTLDQMPFGNFIEIEGEASEIEAVALKLGLDPKDNIQEPYDTLYTRRMKEKGFLAEDHIRFKK